MTLAFLVLLCLSGGEVCAWGKTGHRVTCEIAFQEMNPATRRAVLDLLAAERPRYRRFNRACLWADEDGRRPPHETTKHLHFANVPRGAERVDIARDCGGPGDDGCVITAIARHAGLLMRDGAREAERRDALKFLVHWVGDVHQPLHVAHADDSGANRVLVSFMGKRHVDSERRERMNLHVVWDVELLRAAGATSRNAEPFARDLRRGITEADRRAWGRLDPMAWAEESLDITRRHVYRGGRSLGRRYVDRCVPHVLTRLRQGGVRLARLLEAIFSDRPPFHVGDRTGETYHHPACAAVRLIETRNLQIHASPPSMRRLHRGCPERIEAADFLVEELESGGPR